MNSIKLIFALQEADDGSTIHFGGQFSMIPSTAEADDSTDFYFTGNDRQSDEPVSQVLKALNDWHGVTIPYQEDNKFEYLIHKAIYEKQSLLLLLDNNVVSSIEPA